MSITWNEEIWFEDDTNNWVKGYVTKLPSGAKIGVRKIEKTGKFIFSINGVFIKDKTYKTLNIVKDVAMKHLIKMQSLERQEMKIWQKNNFAYHRVNSRQTPILEDGKF